MVEKAIDGMSRQFSLNPNGHLLLEEHFRFINICRSCFAIQDDSRLVYPQAAFQEDANDLEKTVNRVVFVYAYRFADNLHGDYFRIR